MRCPSQTPRRMLAAVSVLVALVASPVLGAPAPLTDVSRTSVDVRTARQEFVSHSPRFAVTLNRVDDLVSDTGAIVAERRSTFELTFDVAYGGDDFLLLNGVPVVANMVNPALQVEAEMTVDTSQLRELENASGATFHSADDVRDAAMKAFDVGLATVQVVVEVTTVYVRVAAYAPLLPLRRFNLSEKVVEVNGQSVVQTTVGEQVYFVAPNGRFVGLGESAEWVHVSVNNSSAADAGVPAAPSAMKAAVGSGCEGFGLASRYARWSRNLSPFAAAVFVSTMVAIGFAGFISIAIAVVRFVRASRDDARATEESVEKTGDAKGPAYFYLPVDEKTPVCPPSYETLVDEAQAGDVRGDEAPVDPQGKQPGDGENENDALCQ
ncbi:MAG: hypothetical protein BJ554DRAFT_5507 [Olpidium bornovanus]|uniref:Uncharacterized protein n=1 Tax=Olpidium bornovanus TaxID=278681 RepID=A0A8H7ZZK3_9FUNG|nr:MAG: hypothetical protein BJ554DRAFT_5507 [Olpidium bornovanus]